MRSLGILFLVLLSSQLMLSNSLNSQKKPKLLEKTQYSLLQAKLKKDDSNGEEIHYNQTVQIHTDGDSYNPEVIDDQQEKESYEKDQIDQFEEEVIYDEEVTVKIEVQECLGIATECLILLLDMDVEANDCLDDLEDYIDDHWDGEVDDSGEDCARYGGEKAGNWYYVALNLDFDEFDIITGDHRGILDDFKEGMDEFYKEMAEDEEDEDDLQNDEINWNFMQKKSKKLSYHEVEAWRSDYTYDYYENAGVEKVNDLLIQAFDLIHESDPNANDLLYAADELMDKIWDSDYEDAAKNMYSEDRGRTDYIFMEMVKLDIDEIAYLTQFNKQLLDALFIELYDCYEENEGEKWEKTLFMQVQSKLQKITNTYSGYDQKKIIYRENSDTDDNYKYNEEIVEDEHDEDEEHNAQILSSFCEGMVTTMELISQVNHTVNTFIEEKLGAVLDAYFQGDHTSAAEDCYQYNITLSDWLLVQLAEIDTDEASFLTSYSKNFMKEYANGIRAWYRDEIAPLYDFFLLELKDDDDLEHLKEDDDEGSTDQDVYMDQIHGEDAAEYVLSVLEEIVESCNKADGSVNEVIEIFDDFISDAYNGDYERAVKDIYKYDTESTDLIYGWIARTDVNELTFLIGANEAILDQILEAFDDVYQDAHSTGSSLEDLPANSSTAEFLEQYLYCLNQLYYGHPEANSVTTQLRIYVDDTWDGDTEQAAKDCYATATELTRKVFAWFLRVDADEVEFLPAQNQDFHNEFFGDLQDIFQEQEAEIYEFVQITIKNKKKDISNLQQKLLQTHSYSPELGFYELKEIKSLLMQKKTRSDPDEASFVDEFCNKIVVAFYLTSDVNGTANSLIEDDIIVMFEDYYDDDYEQAAEDCYKNDEEQADWMLVTYAELEVDDATFLSSDSMDFLDDFAAELQAYAEETWADSYSDDVEEFLQRKDDNETETDTGAYLLYWMENCIYMTTSGNETVNDWLAELDAYVESTYDDDYDAAAGDMYNYDSNRTNYVYGWLARMEYYDIDFLTSDNQDFYFNMQEGLDEIYSEVDYKQDVSYSITGTQDFLQILYAGLERLYYGNPDGESAISAADDYYDEAWDEDADDAVADCYETDSELTSDVFGALLRIDYDELEFLEDDSEEFLDAFYLALQDFYEEAYDENYEFIQKKKKEISIDKLKSLDRFYQLTQTKTEIKSKRAKQFNQKVLLQESTSQETANRLADMIALAIDKIEVADANGNKDCEEIDDFIQHHYMEDYEDAVQALIEYCEEEAADIFIAFNDLDLDECGFLSVWSIEVMNKIYYEMKSEYDEICDDYTMFLQYQNLFQQQAQR